jgi:hypothetical protein
MAKLSASRRKALPKSSFALPSKRKYPIDTKARAKAALAYSARSDTVGSYKTVRAAVTKKYPSLKKTGGKKK